MKKALFLMALALSAVNAFAMSPCQKVTLNFQTWGNYAVGGIVPATAPAGTAPIMYFQTLGAQEAADPTSEPTVFPVSACLTPGVYRAEFNIVTHWLTMTHRTISFYPVCISANGATVAGRNCVDPRFDQDTPFDDVVLFKVEEAQPLSKSE